VAGPFRVRALEQQKNHEACMSGTNEFIAEVTRAASEVQTLGPDDARRFILRSVSTIREMRQLVGIPSNGSYDTVFDLLKIATSAGQQPPSDLARALLMAADMMRTLHMVIDSRDAISLTGICQSR
jgi:hypothetical protein